MARKTYSKKIKNGTEYYFYRLYDDKNIPKDIYARTVKALEEKIKSAKAEASGAIVNSKQRFGDYFSEWLFETHLIDKKPSTKELYVGTYNNYIKSASFSRIKLMDLEASDIQKYYNALFKQGKSTNIIKKIHKLLSPGIRYAAITERLNKDFSKLLVIPQDKGIIQEKSKIAPFSSIEQNNFEKAIKNEYLGVLYLTALYSGMRQGELFALTWNDILFEEKKIIVSKTYKVAKDVTTQKTNAYVSSPKTATSNRIIPVPDKLVTFLQAHQVTQSQILQKHGLSISKKLPVFSTPFGTYLDASNVRKNLKTILEKAGIENKRFHDLRHTYATRLFELGESPKTVQVLLGHSDISITLNTYTHVLETVTIEASSKLNDLVYSD